MKITKQQIKEMKDLMSLIGIVSRFVFKSGVALYKAGIFLSKVTTSAVKGAAFTAIPSAIGAGGFYLLNLPVSMGISGGAIIGGFASLAYAFLPKGRFNKTKFATSILTAGVLLYNNPVSHKTVAPKASLKESSAKVFHVKSESNKLSNKDFTLKQDGKIIF